MASIECIPSEWRARCLYNGYTYISICIPSTIAQMQMFNVRFGSSVSMWIETPIQRVPFWMDVRSRQWCHMYIIHTQHHYTTLLYSTCERKRWIVMIFVAKNTRLAIYAETEKSSIETIRKYFLACFLVLLLFLSNNTKMCDRHF